MFAPMHEIIAPLDGKGGLYLGNIKAANDHKTLDLKEIFCVVTVICYLKKNLVLPDRFVIKF